MDLVRLPPVLDDRMRGSGSQERESPDPVAGGTPDFGNGEEEPEEEPDLGDGPEVSPGLNLEAVPAVLPPQPMASQAPAVEHKEVAVPKEEAVHTLGGPSAELTQITSTAHKKQWNVLTRVAAGPRSAGPSRKRLSGAPQTIAEGVEEDNACS